MIGLMTVTGDDALRHWQALAPHLERLLPWSLGRWTMADLYQEIGKGEMAVFAAVDTENSHVLAVATGRGFPHARKKVFEVTSCAGVQMDRWIHLWPAVVEQVRRMGFDQIEVVGRKGWGRVLSGVQEVSRTYVLDLPPLAEPQEVVHG